MLYCQPEESIIFPKRIQFFCSIRFCVCVCVFDIFQIHIFHEFSSLTTKRMCLSTAWFRVKTLTHPLSIDDSSYKYQAINILIYNLFLGFFLRCCSPAPWLLNLSWYCISFSGAQKQSATKPHQILHIRFRFTCKFNCERLMLNTLWSFTQFRFCTLKST